MFFRVVGIGSVREPVICPPFFQWWTKWVNGCVLSSVCMGWASVWRMEWKSLFRWAFFLPLSLRLFPSLLHVGM